MSFNATWSMAVGGMVGDGIFSVLGVVVVIALYIVVALGATMLVGAGTLVEEQEVALSIAGQRALGTPGLVLVTVAAAFSTGSAINATLFSTGRLMESVSEKHDLPDLFAKENKERVPAFAILCIGAVAALLAVLGDLGTLVDSASLIFLFTFGVVNAIAFRERVPGRFLCLAGTALCALAIVVAGIEQFRTAPRVLLTMLILIALLFAGRRWFLRRR